MSMYAVNDAVNT